MFRIRRRTGSSRYLPISKKLLQENAGQLMIHILPTVKFYCQSFIIPGISLQALRQPTPLPDRPVHGTKMAFNTLSLTFRVDQNLENFIEIFDWMCALAPPKELKQYRLWTEERAGNLTSFRQRGTVSDATLITFTNQENPNSEIVFKDLFPTSLSDIIFQTTTQDAQELVCSATFEYLSYDIVRRPQTK